MIAKTMTAMMTMVLMQKVVMIAMVIMTAMITVTSVMVLMIIAMTLSTMLVQVVATMLVNTTFMANMIMTATAPPAKTTEALHLILCFGALGSILQCEQLGDTTSRREGRR